MDKLKPILEQRFWILSGLAILLSPIGWWVSTGSIAKTTADRIKTIEGKAKSIPDPKKSEMPNKQWIDGAKQVKAELTGLVNETHRRLYDRQREKMVWVRKVQVALKEAGVETRNDKEDPRAIMIAKDYFASTYDDAWKKVVDIIDPFDWLKGDGKVLVDPAGDAVTKKPMTAWRRTLIFSKDDMFDAQEDLWLMKELMEAIARVNQGATQISDAHIKKLTQLKLRGGDATDLAGRQSGAIKAQQGSSVAPGSKMRMAIGPGAATQQELAFTPPKEFDADDVFGADGSSGSTQTQSMDKKDKGAIALVEVRPYVEENEKWKKRGFVLRVVMDQRQIPTLVAELTRSVFPVEIRHVEHSDYDPGKDLQQITALQPGPAGEFASVNTNPADDASQTEEQRQQRIRERIRSVLNQNILADVIIAGQFTIYKEPPKDGSPTSKPAAQPTGAVDPKAMAAATGQKAGQPATTGSAPGAKPTTPAAPKTQPSAAASGSTQTPVVGSVKSGAQTKAPVSSASAASKTDGAKPAGKPPQSPGK